MSPDADSVETVHDRSRPRHRSCPATEQRLCDAPHSRCQVISSCFGIAAAIVKFLAWDQSGFWVLYKRLERGTFAWPADDAEAPVTIRSGDLLLLLSGVDLAHTRRRRCYERVA